MESIKPQIAAGSRGHTPRTAQKYSENISERARRRLNERLELLEFSPANSNAFQKTKGSKQPTDNTHLSSSVGQKPSEITTPLSAVLIHKEDPSDLLAARKCSSTASTLIRLLSESPACINVNGSLATALARKVTDLVPVPGAKSAEDEALAGLSRQRRYEMNLSRCMDEMEATVEALEASCYPAGPPVTSLPAPRFASPTPSQALLSPVRDRSSASPQRRRLKPQIFASSPSPTEAAFGVDSVDAVEEQCKSIISALTAATELASKEAKDKKMHHLWSQAVDAVSAMEQMKEQVEAMKLEVEKTKRKCKELETCDAQETLLKSRVHEKAQKGKRDTELQQLRAQFEDSKKENQELQGELDRIGFQLVSSQIASSSKHVVEARIRQCEGKMADMEQQRVDDLVLASARIESLEELDRTLALRTGELKAARGQVGELKRAASEAKEEATKMAWGLQRMSAVVTESNTHSRAAVQALEETMEELLDKDREVQRLRAMLQASDLKTPMYDSSSRPGPLFLETSLDAEPDREGGKPLPDAVGAEDGAGGTETVESRDEEDSSSEEQEASSPGRGEAKSSDGGEGAEEEGRVLDAEVALERSGGQDSDASLENEMPEWLSKRIEERVRRCSQEGPPETITAVPRTAERSSNMDSGSRVEAPFTPQKGEQNGRSRTSGQTQQPNSTGSNNASSPISPGNGRRTSYNLPRPFTPPPFGEQDGRSRTSGQKQQPSSTGSGKARSPITPNTASNSARRASYNLPNLVSR